MGRGVRGGLAGRRPGGGGRPLRPQHPLPLGGLPRPHLGREGVLADTRQAYASEGGQDPRFGTPFAAGASAAVEWWTTTLEDGQPATLIGTSVLTFTPDGLVATARDYWFLEPGTHQPFDGWGR